MKRLTMTLAVLATFTLAALAAPDSAGLGAAVCKDGNGNARMVVDGEGDNGAGGAQSIDISGGPLDGKTLEWDDDSQSYRGESPDGMIGYEVSFDSWWDPSEGRWEYEWRMRILHDDPELHDQDVDESGAVMVNPLNKNGYWYRDGRR